MRAGFPSLPNILTIARIALVPVFALVYILTEGYYWIASMLFAAAAFTDWLDGYLARKLDQTTPFGAFLDPVADKLIVVTALVLLIGNHASLWLTLPGVIIIGREIVISALREWMAEMNRRGLVAVSWMARVKTGLQMLAIFILLANPPVMNRPWVILGLVLLYAAALLTIWSMVIYGRAAWPTLREGLRDNGP
ncbi:MAG: CDP-diacylglycerol--glycerol-3-phosphate 3-phosphatidyltransferase [Gammaproteobacteria bacterium]|nr:CDP-diacylglycerol--glycerol-3-phosphate 3-phosphatidyltransferase [Gammaproteobacteria bacterium]